MNSMERYNQCFVDSESGFTLRSFLLATEDDLVQLGFKMAERRLLREWIRCQTPVSVLPGSVILGPVITPEMSSGKHSSSIVESPILTDTPSSTNCRPTTGSHPTPGSTSLNVFKVSHFCNQDFYNFNYSASVLNSVLACV
jgi:hypothetical protein